jgi:F0F1-type ATP synthase membrane subunit b/b'
MIAWENRDIEAQQEFVDLVQEQLDEALADQKERLQELLRERTQVLSDIRKERQALVAQRKELKKKPVADNIRAAAQPPSQ